MAILTSNPTRDDIATLAKAHGFDAVRVASAHEPWDAGAGLRAFLDAGHHGDMDWLETSFARRQHPTAMWAEAKTALMLGVNYGPEDDPLSRLAQRQIGNISVYAQGDDYHDVIKKRLKALAGELHASLNTEVKVFVDTAPLMEKPLAVRAGLGWQGKHTNLVSRQFGSWLFLGAILLACEISPDAPEVDHCGSCTACLDICPTKAFPAPNQLDARRCISYLTIEHKGPIPSALRAAMGNRIYGCDDCLAVCPWNKYAKLGSHVRLQARDDLRAPALVDLAYLDDATFRARFAKNPVKRIGVVRFLRNVAIAIGNSGLPELIGAAQHLVKHDSPLVRGAAVWALAQLLSPADFQALAAKALPKETDASVAEEWTWNA
jgi:epoxyqueuosine reductase